MVRDRRPSGSLENDVLACLAGATDPLTAAEVRTALGERFAYTTVLTALARLYEKQALTRESRGRAYAYSLAGGAKGAHANMTAHRMRKLLASDSDQRSVLLRFVDGLDPQSEQVLRDLLAEHSGDETDVGPARRRKGRRG